MKHKFFVRLIISLLMLVVILHNISFSQFLSVINSTPVTIVITAVLGYFLGQIMSVYKWRKIFQAESPYSLPFSKALSSYFIGMYVNAFGLGVVGGDVVRGLLVSARSRTHGIATVAADRFHGLAVLAVLGVFSAFLFGHGHLKVGFLYLLGGIALAVPVGWYAAPPLLNALCGKYKRLKEISEEIKKGFPRSPKILLEITLISLAFHLLQIFLHWFILKGIGANAPFSFLLMTVPFVNILSSLPISWNGLGVRETAYLFFFSPFYAAKEQCVALGLIWLFAMTSNAVLGGLAAVLTGDLKKIAGKEALKHNPKVKEKAA